MSMIMMDVDDSAHQWKKCLEERGDIQAAQDLEIDDSDMVVLSLKKLFEYEHVSDILEYLIQEDYDKWQEDETWGSGFMMALSSPDYLEVLRLLMSVARKYVDDWGAMVKCIDREVINSSTREHPSHDRDVIEILRQEGLEFAAPSEFNFSNWSEGLQAWNDTRVESLEICFWGVEYASRTLHNVNRLEQLLQVYSTKVHYIDGPVSDYQQDTVEMLKKYNISIEPEDDGSVGLTERWSEQLHSGNLDKARWLQVKAPNGNILDSEYQGLVCLTQLVKLPNAVQVLEYLETEINFNSWEYENDLEIAINYAAGISENDFELLRKLIHIVLTNEIFGTYFTTTVTDLIEGDHTEHDLALLSVCKQEGLEQCTEAEIDFSKWPEGEKVWNHVDKKRKLG